MKWKYTPRIEFSTHLPQQFQLLCNLMKVSPKAVIYQMMCHISSEHYAKGGAEQKAKAKEYFISCGYGEDFYSAEEIDSIFNELEAIGKLFPHGSKGKLFSRYCKWKNSYYQYLFRNWHRKFISIK